MERHALIVGVGDGLSASLARQLFARGYTLTLVARNTAKLGELERATKARTVELDAADPVAVADMVAQVPSDLRVAIFNPSARQRGPIAELDPDTVRRAVEVTAFGAFLVGQAATKRMLEQDADETGKKGTILFTGASAGVKGFPNSAPFAMGKFAQRGLAQSMSRELHPKGIHVAWINIDGAIRNSGNEESPDTTLDPEAIAASYLGLIDQHRSAWSEELTLRPWVERF